MLRLSLVRKGAAMAIAAVGCLLSRAEANDMGGHGIGQRFFVCSACHLAPDNYSIQHKADLIKALRLYICAGCIARHIEMMKVKV